MFGLGVWELLIILAIILVLFGAKRLRNLGTDLGSAIKGFRSAVKEEDDETEDRSERERVIEGEVGSSTDSGSDSQSARRKHDSNV